MGGPFLNFGVERVLNSYLNFVRNSLPVYVRMRKFIPPENNLAGQLGFALTPTGSDVGTVDVRMCPTPAVRMVSMHNIGQSGGKLRFGARQFLFTQANVRALLKLYPDVPDGMTFWRDPRFVGLFTDGKLFSVEDIAHEELGGVTVEWTLTCNANDLK